MGHQFFERLAGECVSVFQFELKRDTPDPGVAADAGCKAVHNRVVQLLAAGDLERAVAAVNEVLRAASIGNPNVQNSISTAAAVIDRLRGCVYRDEAQRVAIVLLRAPSQQGTCDIDDALRSTAQMFAEQLSRMESVLRLPQDGLFGMQELARDLAVRMATRVSDNLIRQRRDDPEGWRKNRWRAPRALTPKPNSEEMGDGLDLSKKSDK